MTRPSRRELERAIDRLETESVSTAQATTLVVPDTAIRDADLPPEPGVSVDAVTVADEETGDRRHIIPLHLAANRTDGVPMVAERSLRNAWGDLDAEQRQRERSLREKHDLPIPSILEDTKT